MSSDFSTIAKLRGRHLLELQKSCTTRRSSSHRFSNLHSQLSFAKEPKSESHIVTWLTHRSCRMASADESIIVEFAQIAWLCLNLDSRLCCSLHFASVRWQPKQEVLRPKWPKPSTWSHWSHWSHWSPDMFRHVFQKRVTKKYQKYVTFVEASPAPASWTSLQLVLRNISNVWNVSQFGRLRILSLWVQPPELM